MSDLATLLTNLDAETRRTVIAALIGLEAQHSGVTVPAKEALSGLEDCAEVEHAVPQWMTADGQQRGVWLRAREVKDAMLAERAATTRDAKGNSTFNEWKHMCEVVARCITRPRDVHVDTLLGWNEAVVRGMYERILEISALPAALIAAELARLAGGPPPPRSSEAAHDPRPDADELDGEPGAGAEPSPDGDSSVTG